MFQLLIIGALAQTIQRNLCGVITTPVSDFICNAVIIDDGSSRITSTNGEILEIRDAYGNMATNVQASGYLTINFNIAYKDGQEQLESHGGIFLNLDSPYNFFYNGSSGPSLLLGVEKNGIYIQHSLNTNMAFKVGKFSLTNQVLKTALLGMSHSMNFNSGLRYNKNFMRTWGMESVDWMLASAPNFGMDERWNCYTSSMKTLMDMGISYDPFATLIPTSEFLVLLKKVASDYRHLDLTKHKNDNKIVLETATLIKSGHFSRFQFVLDQIPEHFYQFSNQIDDKLDFVVNNIGEPFYRRHNRFHSQLYFEFSNWMVFNVKYYILDRSYKGDKVNVTGAVGRKVGSSKPLLSSRCGFTWIHAHSTCNTACHDDGPCVGLEMKCFADLALTPCLNSTSVTEKSPAPTNSRCGKSWHDANTNCFHSCTEYDSTACMGLNMTCWANLSMEPCKDGTNVQTVTEKLNNSSQNSPKTKWWPW